MEIIPAINATSFEVAERHIVQAAAFAPWLHIDITDGIFTKNFVWGKPDELHRIITTHGLKTQFEIHLMVTEPELLVEPWIRSGAKRVIVHVEAMTNPPYVLELIKQLQGEVMLAAKPATPAERLLIYKDDFPKFQVLAVEPGLAGQKFQESVVTKIKTLREKAPNAIIEVDGGVNMATAKVCKEAGANLLVSASAIFAAPDPKKAYEELSNI
jgi:ribulose-phosphate 3-epimerase